MVPMPALAPPSAPDAFAPPAGPTPAPSRRSMRSLRLPWMLSALAAVALSGCASKPKHPIAKQDLLPQPTIYPPLQGTIGSFAAVASNRPIVVKGYGLVVNLPNTGSGEMPGPVRTKLADQLMRDGFGYRSTGLHKLNPAAILRSRQVAAVFVEGIIPPMSPRGTVFDLNLAALPNTQTTNLTNGLLWTTPLRVHTQPGRTTRHLGLGRGPLFCNPFAKPNPNGHTIIRTARVLSGGVVTRSLPAILELYNPSYRIAGLIQRAVNERFGDNPPFADAINDSMIRLRIPERYRSDPKRFVRLVIHMYLAEDVPGFASSRAIRLMRDMARPNAPHRQLGMALQGLGRTIVPLLRKDYTSPDPTLGFYVAKAGAAMHDSEAMVVLDTFARTPGKYQLAAIKAIADNRDTMHSTITLSHLLDTSDLRVRIAAYKALLKCHSLAVDSRAIGEKYIVDLVPSKGPPLIYVSQTGLPRIALIGEHFGLPQGTLYISQHNALTINYPLGRRRPARVRQAKFPVMLYFRGRMAKHAVKLHASPHLPAVLLALSNAPDPRATNFDPFVPYIGLSYQRIVQMLAYMAKQKIIHATFVMQKPPRQTDVLVALANKMRPQGSRKAGKPAKANPYSTALPGEK